MRKKTTMNTRERTVRIDSDMIDVKSCWRNVRNGRRWVWTKGVWRMGWGLLVREGFEWGEGTYCKVWREEARDCWWEGDARLWCRRAEFISQFWVLQFQLPLFEIPG